MRVSLQYEYCDGYQLYLYLQRRMRLLDVLASMETLFPLLRYYVYTNPMFYWMNICSSNIVRIIGYLPWYLLGSTLPLIAGCIIINQKEIK